MTRRLDAIGQSLASDPWHMNLARTIALRFANQHCPDLADDLIGVANLTLVSAAACYAEGYGVKFSTYAYRSIWRDLYHYYRLELRRGVATGVLTVAWDDRNRLVVDAIAGALSDDDPACWAADYQDEVEHIASTLPKARQRRFFRMRHAMASGVTLSVVAKQMGMSLNWACLLNRQIAEVMARRMERERRKAG